LEGVNNFFILAEKTHKNYLMFLRTGTNDICWKFS